MDEKDHELEDQADVEPRSRKRKRLDVSVRSDRHGPIGLAEAERAKARRATVRRKSAPKPRARVSPPRTPAQWRRLGRWAAIGTASLAVAGGTAMARVVRPWLISTEQAALMPIAPSAANEGNEKGNGRTGHEMGNGRTEHDEGKSGQADHKNREPAAPRSKAK